MAKKPKRSNEDLAVINDLAVKLVRRELQHYADSPTERVPAALLSTAGMILKSYNVPEEATEEERAEQVASTSFKSRLSPQWLCDMVGYGEIERLFSGVDEDDFVNCERIARFQAKKFPEDSNDRRQLEQIAREAAQRQAKLDAQTPAEQYAATPDASDDSTN